MAKNKIYVSQWLKLKNKEARIINLRRMEDKELNLLVDLVYNSNDFLGIRGELPNLLAMAFGVEKAITLLEKYKTSNTLLGLVPHYGAKRINDRTVTEILTEIYIKERDYNTLFLLGRLIVIYLNDNNILLKYVDAMLPLLKEYKYGEGKTTNPVSCLANLAAEVEMRVDKYLKENNLIDAQRKWEELKKIK